MTRNKFTSNQSRERALHGTIRPLAFWVNLGLKFFLVVLLAQPPKLEFPESPPQAVIRKCQQPPEGDSHVHNEVEREDPNRETLAAQGGSGPTVPFVHHAFNPDTEVRAYYDLNAGRRRANAALFPW